MTSARSIRPAARRGLGGRSNRSMGPIGSQREQVVPGANSAESRQLITFALAWAPFGGPPSDEIFERYGMTLRRFLDVLWSCAEQAPLRSDERALLANAYPWPSRAGGRARRSRV